MVPLVNSSMLELTLKSTFQGLNKEIPLRPIFALHSLNPCHYAGHGNKIIQLCNNSKFIPSRDTPHVRPYIVDYLDRIALVIYYCLLTI